MEGGTTLVWSLPTSMIGEITSYEIMIQVIGKSTSGPIVQRDPSIFYFVPLPNHFEGAQNQGITLQVTVMVVHVCIIIGI